MNRAMLRYFVNTIHFSKTHTVTLVLQWTCIHVKWPDYVNQQTKTFIFIYITDNSKILIPFFIIRVAPLLEWACHCIPPVKLMAKS